MVGAFSRFVTTLLAIAVLAAPAAAREDYCIVPGSGGTIDAQATAQFRRLDQQVNARLMRLLRGTWYTVVFAGPQVSEVWETFGPDRLYSYANLVCDTSTGFCSWYGQNSTGLYAVRAHPDNANRFVGMKIVSDIHRDHECRGLVGTFRNVNVWVGNGFVARRVPGPGFRPQ